jgi:hypothetical protein
MKELSDRPNAMKPKKGWTLTVVLKASVIQTAFPKVARTNINTLYVCRAV